MKGKIDLIVIDDREYDNQFTEFTPYFEKALKMAIEHNTSELEWLNYEVDSLENVPTFKQYQCIIDLNNKGDEYYHSDKIESYTAK